MNLVENSPETPINSGLFPGCIPGDFVFGNDLKVDVRTGNLVTDGRFMTDQEFQQGAAKLNMSVDEYKEWLDYADTQRDLGIDVAYSTEGIDTSNALEDGLIKQLAMQYSLNKQGVADSLSNDETVKLLTTFSKFGVNLSNEQLKELGNINPEVANQIRERQEMNGDYESILAGSKNRNNTENGYDPLAEIDNINKMIKNNQMVKIIEQYGLSASGDLPIQNVNGENIKIESRSVIGNARLFPNLGGKSWIILLRDGENESKIRLGLKDHEMIFSTSKDETRVNINLQDVAGKLNILNESPPSSSIDLIIDKLTTKGDQEIVSKLQMQRKQAERYDNWQQSEAGKQFNNYQATYSNDIIDFHIVNNLREHINYIKRIWELDRFDNIY